MRLVSRGPLRGAPLFFGATLAALILLATPVVSRAVPDDEDWSKSPEAYFLTNEEREEWKRLGSREERTDFKERYFLRRDPTPGTEANEFRDALFQRIEMADKRFPIEKTPGSRTAQGFAFIVFGQPFKIQQQRTEGPPSPAATPNQAQVNTAGGATSARGRDVGINEGTEMSYVWVYDPKRNPRMLEAIGRPSLEITIIIEPQRRKDEIQSPGLVNSMREILAQKTIANPDLIPPVASAR